MGQGRPPKGDGEAPSVAELLPTRELEADEQVYWDRWAGVLKATRIFLSTDGPLLTFVVELECRKAIARAALKTDGSYLGGRRHPALTDLDNAHRDQMALLRELGLTPASLKNVKAGKKSKEADELGEFING